MELPPGEDPVAGTGVITSGFEERWLPRMPKQFGGRVDDPTHCSAAGRDERILSIDGLQGPRKSNFLGSIQRFLLAVILSANSCSCVVMIAIWDSFSRFLVF